MALVGAFLALVALGGATAEPGRESEGRSFTIDYANNQFLKDGEPFRYISGSIHYFRVLPSEWRDRLRKMRMAGFNALQTYVEWSSHEPEHLTYNFDGMLDLPTFLKTAQEEDLLVILRPGPFVNAERDIGGLPYWLLNKNQDMRLRSSDPTFLRYVDDWFGGTLLPLIKPLLYENGGPIIMLQVENEYGSYPDCDFAYTSHLRDVVRLVLGDGLVLFTTDTYAVNRPECGKIPEVYATTDFYPGTDVEKAFGAMRLFEPKGPLVNSEYYVGWLDHWGAPHRTRDTEDIVRTLDEMLALNASVNVYVFHGGTSFGLTSGSNLDRRFHPCPTSYDYNAPLSEAGNPTEKYWALRNIISKYLPLPSGDVPPASPKHSYGKVSVAPAGNVFQMADFMQTVTNEWPLTFEELLVPNGIVVYKTVLPFRIADPARLTLGDIHDRGYVFVDAEFAGMVSREQDMYDLAIYAQPNQTISIVVESQGRVGFGPHVHDFKGLTTNATISGHMLQGWSMAPLPLTNATRLSSAMSRLRHWVASERLPLHRMLGTHKGGMTFFTGSFQVPDEPSHPMDTFLRLDGWNKGIAWVNNFCLGRYWPEVGPQVTLYVPRGVLKQGTNSLLLLEQETAPCLSPDTCYVTLTDTHVIDGPTPKRPKKSPPSP